MAQVLGVAEDLLPGARGGDGVEGGRLVDLHRFGVDPDAEALVLAPDHDGP